MVCATGPNNSSLNQVRWLTLGCRKVAIVINFIRIVGIQSENSGSLTNLLSITLD